MPIFEIQGPDGKTYEADAPDMQTAAKAFAPQSSVDRLKGLVGAFMPGVPLAEAALHTLTGGLSQVASGYAGLGHMATNALGITDGDPAATVAATQQGGTYQPMTPQGQSIANTIDTAANNTVGRLRAGAGAINRGVSKALGGNENDQQLASDLGGGVFDAGSLLLGEGANALAKRSVAKAADAAAQLGPQAEARQAAHAAGYPVDPTTAGASGLSTALEGFSGIADLKKVLALKAQMVTQRLAKQDLGLPANVPLKPQVLNALEGKATQAYDALRGADDNVTHSDATGAFKPAPGRAGPIITDADFHNDVQQIGKDRENTEFEPSDDDKRVNAATEQLRMSLDKDNFTPNAVLQKIKDLRQAAANTESRAGATYADKQIARAQREAAAALEAQAERYLSNTGQSNLYGAFTDARKQIAKIKEYRDAMNPSTGMIDAEALAKSKNRDAFTGGLKTIADAHDALPTTVKNTDAIIGAQPLSALGGMALTMEAAKGAATAVGAGAGAGAAVGHPLLGAGITLGGLLARHGIRKALASDAYQARLHVAPPIPSGLAQLASNDATPLAALLAGSDQPPPQGP